MTVTRVYLLERAGRCVQAFLDLPAAKTGAAELVALAWQPTQVRKLYWNHTGPIYDLFTTNVNGRLVMLNVRIKLVKLS